MIDELPSTLFEIFERSASRWPDRAAICALDREPLTHAGLLARLVATGRGLAACGVAPTDRVAVVVRNGPVAATATWCLAAHVPCAPLDPDAREGELAQELARVRARALVIDPTLGDAPRRAAERLGLPCIELEIPADAPAGTFELRSRRVRDETAASTPFPPGPADACALVLATSGTAGQPKRVALTHAQLGAAASYTARALELSEADRSLNVLPLFHVHGLVGAVLAPLLRGGSVVCTPGFHAASVFEWIERTRPTWLTAVPSIHQSILARAELEPGRARAAGLRFLRSASAPLPRAVIERLEPMFAAPLIETYGMTEAAPILTCNPMPPGLRKPGSVGRPAGPEVAILDDAGRIVRPSERVEVRGEVVARGRNVIAAHDDDPEHDREAFVEGWLRTGDLGYFDADGYLFVVGRRREMINRAGEKVAPAEVEGVLLRHPAVREAAVFAVEDERLGEAVAAAIVLRDGASCSEDELAELVAVHLSDPKVPAIFVRVPEIPKGPTGKLVRRDLAARLGVPRSRAATSPAVAPRGTDVERRLQAIFAEVLRLASVRADASFFALGGDSMSAVQVVAAVKERLGVELRPRVLHGSPTAAELAVHVEARLEGAGAVAVEVIPRVPRSERMPTSPHQDRWLQLHSRFPTFSAMNVSWARIDGDVDIGALREALAHVVARQELLRVAFSLADGRYSQRVATGPGPSLRATDLEGAPLARRREIVAAELAHVFALEGEPLLRLHLLRFGEREHRLLINLHHAIGDHWSKQILCRELLSAAARLSRGQHPDEPALPLQYVDFASWHERVVREQHLPARRDYWARRLAGDPTVSLHGAMPSGGVAPPAGGVPIYFGISSADARALRAVATSQRVGLVVLLQLGLLMAWSERLEHRHERFSFSSIATISRDRSDLMDVIGPMGEPLPICTQLSPRMTIREALAHLHDANLEAVENALPITTLVRCVELKRRPRVSFNYLSAPRPGPRDGALRWSLELERPYDRVPELPGDGELVIYARDATDGGLEICFLYNERNLEPDAVGGLKTRMLEALRLLGAGAPNDRCVLSPT